MDALRKQLGEGAYKGLEIQPVDFIKDNYLKFCEGNVVKYLTRSKGSRLEDLEKAYHYISLAANPLLKDLTVVHVKEFFRESYLKDPFFKQFKNGRTYALIMAYTVTYQTPKAKELLRKFINKGQYSEV